jgi:ankyrin repeat protein
MKKVFLFLAVVLAVAFSLSAVFAGEIHEAAKNGNLEKLKALLDKNPELLYVKDELGKTPLHWATGRGQPEAMKLLLDTYKVDVNVRNNNLGTPLHVAASQAQPECTKNGSTPLHFAAFKGQKAGHREAAKILLENGADVNAKTDTGATPLSMAAYRNNTEIIAILRTYGAQGGTSQRRRSSKMTPPADMEE